MKHLKWTITLLLLVVSELIFAQEWIPIVKTDKSSFYILEQSLRINKIQQDNEYIFMVLGKHATESTADTEVNAWIVTAGDCLKKQGTFYMADKNGKIVLKTEFSFASNTISSIISKIICTTALDVLTKPNSVGI
jgi:hypothetical protein